MNNLIRRIKALMVTSSDTAMGRMRFISVYSVVPLALGCLMACLSHTAVSEEPESDGEKREIKVITNSIGIKLARIPAGKFVMGSPGDEAERNSEELSHEVVISRPFYIGVYEVTQHEFDKVVITEKRKPKAVFHPDNGGSPDHPMENVEWKRAIAFCNALSDQPKERSAGRKYRLPTEAEWEYACRAGSQTAFHFGDALSSSQANFNGNYPHGDGAKGPYLRKTAKIGSYKPNAFGLFDMHGNVSEWCADWYDRDYYRDSPEEDPLGPPVGVLKTEFDGDFYVTVRGGCWLDDARACRSACRFYSMPADPYRLIGFRVVCEVTEDAGQ